MWRGLSKNVAQIKDLPKSEKRRRILLFFFIKIHSTIYKVYCCEPLQISLHTGITTTAMEKKRSNFMKNPVQKWKKKSSFSSSKW